MNTRNLTILVTDGWYCGDDLEQALQAIAPGCRVFGEDELKADPSLVQKAQVVYGRLDKSLFASCRELRYLHAPFDGMEWSNNDEVRSHPVILTNSRFHDVPVSEQLFGLLLVLVRRLHESIRRPGQWYRPPIDQVDTLSGKTLCIVGAGTIGRRCGTIARALGMKTIAVTRHGWVNHPQAEKNPLEGGTAPFDFVLPIEQLLEALAQSQVVINLLPLTPQTAGLFGDREFAAMPAGGYFLNAGRGKTVQTDALVRALQSGHLQGAGLDVVDPEPLPGDHPLWQMRNAVIAAHYGGSFAGYRQKANELFVENLRRFLAGEELLNVVDKVAGY